MCTLCVLGKRKRNGAECLIRRGRANATLRIVAAHRFVSAPFRSVRWFSSPATDPPPSLSPPLRLFAGPVAPVHARCRPPCRTSSSRGRTSGATTPCRRPTRAEPSRPSWMVDVSCVNLVRERAGEAGQGEWRIAGVEEIHRAWTTDTIKLPSKLCPT